MRKQMIDRFRPRGHVKILLKDADGNVIERYEKDNLVVNSGRNLLRDFISGSTVSGLTHIALGTGVGEPNPADTQLINEIDRRTFAATYVGDQMFKISAFYTFDEVNTSITEAGLFGNGADSTPNSGTLYARVSFDPPIDKNNQVTLTIEWTLYF